MIKKYIRKLLEQLGYKLTKIQTYDNAFKDIKRLLKSKEQPIIFDVGANIAQSINQFLTYLPGSIIYAFEPGPDTYSELLAKNINRKNIYLENIAMGSERAKKEFLENEYPDMSSFLEIDRLGWGKLKNKILVDVDSVDSYCETKGILNIDVLKSDTQGFELEVYKGAIQMMKSNNIRLVYFEFIFSDLYKELPSFHEIYRLLIENNFKLVNFYDIHYSEGMVAWADLLFINSKYAEPII